MRSGSGVRAVLAGAPRLLARAVTVTLVILGVVAMHQVPLPHGGEMGHTADPGVHASAPDGMRVSTPPAAHASTPDADPAVIGDSGAQHVMLHLCLAIIVLGLGLLWLRVLPFRARRSVSDLMRIHATAATHARPPPPPDLHVLQVLRL